MSIKIAYFSAEIGLKSEIKTYSGGLGILAGDIIKAMADLNVPFCAITLLYKDGFLKQKIVDDIQVEEDDNWDFLNILEDTQKECEIEIAGNPIYVKIWRYIHKGLKGHEIPIYFLDTDLEKNPKWATKITNKLYQGNRLYQEIVLGIGGIKALEVLGHNEIEKYHMNEGHSCFLTLQLYKDLGEKNGWNSDAVKKKCVFTTHTPIPAGHDKFDYKLVYEAFTDDTKLIPWHIEKIAGFNELNTTRLAMSFSSHINAVSKIHHKVTKKMFPDYDIHYITNGVHCETWTSSYIMEVFDRNIEGWRNDYTKLSKIFNVPNEEILDAHLKAKHDMIKFVNGRNIINSELKEGVLTVGFARRFIEYKDAELIFKNLDRLREIGDKVQFVFSGKTHLNDGEGKAIMKKVIEYARELKDDVAIAFIENYDMNIGKVLVGGCDLWLNTPIPYHEASGTSGMKAATNGCLHFSTLDGWAIESFERNGGGFPIYTYEDLITTLEYKIIPKFYCELSTSWVSEMKLAIGNSASYFNTHRMAKEYIEKTYEMDVNDFNQS